MKQRLREKVVETLFTPFVGGASPPNSLEMSRPGQPRLLSCQLDVWLAGSVEDPRSEAEGLYRVVGQRSK